MRYSQTYVLTLLVSGYPDAWSVMNAIILEADAIIVNPFKIQVLAELIREKMIARKPAVRSAKVKSGRFTAAPWSPHHRTLVGAGHRDSPWQAALYPGLHPRNAGARVRNTSGDPVRDVAAQSGPPGVQLAATRRHDHR